MSRKKIIAVVVLVVSGGLSMWANYAYEKAQQSKREALLRSLATYNTPSSLMPASAPTPDERVDEPRDMFDSELPQELLEQIKQKVGGDFKLMELRVSGSGLQANVSTDASTVQQYERDKTKKTVDGPRAVRIVGGDGKIDDSLYDPSAANLSLIPKLAKEARERAAAVVPDAKVESATFAYAFLRYEGETPEWSFYVAGGEGEGRQSKFVTFDAKGKFKRMF